MEKRLNKNSTKKPSRKLGFGWIAVLSVFLIILSSYFSISLSTAYLPGVGRWLRDFAKSPGAAACAALFAAIIAFYGISKQVKVSREVLDHQQSAGRNSAWWEMFEWASNRGIPLNKEDTPLPDSVTVSTLQALSSEATERVQKVACGSVIDAITKRIESSENKLMSGKGDGLYSSEMSEDTVNALTSYVNSTRGTPGASPWAEAAVYAHAVTENLVSIVDEKSKVTSESFMKLSGSRAKGFRADAVIESGDHRVVVEIMQYRGGNGKESNISWIRNRLLQKVTGMRSAGIADPILLVTPYPAALTVEQQRQNRCVATQWRGAEDNDSLTVAVQEAFLVPPEGYRP